MGSGIRSTRLHTLGTVVLVVVGLGACSSSGGDASRAVELPTPTPTASKTAVLAAAPAKATGRWLSGASGPKAASGAFGRWRRAPLAIGGTWENSNDAQLTMGS